MNRRGLLAPRGIGKTTQVSICVSLYELYRNPESRDLVPSKSERQAKKIITSIRQYIDDIWFLQHLAPRPSKRHRDDSKQFDVGPISRTKDPSVSAYGIDGQIEGTRASKCIPDDVETKNNTKTIDARRELDDTCKEFGSITTFGDRDICYVGTFHHEESVYLKLIERGYVFLTIPLLYPTEDERRRIKGLAPFIGADLDEGRAKPGDIVFSHRKDRQWVIEKQAEGRSHFAMQHMLIADLGDELRYPLKLSDLIVHTVDVDKAPLSIHWGMTTSNGVTTRLDGMPSLGFGNDSLHGPIMFDAEWAKYNGTIMWIDPSGAGTDHTSYAIIGGLNSMLWCKAAGGLEGGYSTATLQQLASLARRHQVTEIFVEDVGLQGMFVQLLRPIIQKHFLEPGDNKYFPNGWRCPVEPEPKWAKGQKEVRIIEVLEPVLNQHRLVISPAAISLDPAPNAVQEHELQYQLTRITRQRGCIKFDDVVEALAACVWKWMDCLDIDPDKAADHKRHQLQQRELEEHYRACGMEVPEPSYINRTW